MAAMYVYGPDPTDDAEMLVGPFPSLSEAIESAKEEQAAEYSDNEAATLVIYRLARQGSVKPPVSNAGEFVPASQE